MTKVQILQATINSGVNEKSSLQLIINCPFVCTAFDFAKVNKVSVRVADMVSMHAPVTMQSGISGNVVQGALSARETIMDKELASDNSTVRDNTTKNKLGSLFDMDDEQH